MDIIDINNIRGVHSLQSVHCDNYLLPLSFVNWASNNAFKMAALLAPSNPAFRFDDASEIMLMSNFETNLIAIN